MSLGGGNIAPIPHPKSTVSRIPAPATPRLRPKSSPKTTTLCQDTFICHPATPAGCPVIPSPGLEGWQEHFGLGPFSR